MLTATIELTGVTEDELVFALEEVKKVLEAGNRSAYETREDDTGSYSLEVTGEESEYIVCPNCGYYNYIVDEDKKPEVCFDCKESLE